MLKNWNKPEKPEAEELEERLEAAKQKLRQQQMLIKDRKLPVFVLFEGWGTAGKGSILGKLILNIDPRFFKVATMDIPTEEEKRKRRSPEEIIACAQSHLGEGGYDLVSYNCEHFSNLCTFGSKESHQVKEVLAMLFGGIRR